MLKATIRTGIVGVAATGLLVGATSMASADHTHVRVTGNGQCVVIAANGGEKYVELPDAVFAHNPNVDVAPTPGRNHPLHVLVHQGRPADAQPGTLFVHGTPAGDAACEAGYLND